MTDWLVFDTEPAATSAVRQIDAKFGNPRKGRGTDGNPKDNAVGETTWAVPVQRLTDGKWVFPAPPFAFDGVAEAWQDAWVEVPEEETAWPS